MSEDLTTFTVIGLQIMEKQFRATAEMMMSQAVVHEKRADACLAELRRRGMAEIAPPVPPVPAALEVQIVPEPSADDCANPEGHKWEPLRQNDQITAEACRYCNRKRWQRTGMEEVWNYGPLPHPKAARIMREGEELGPGEVFVPTDGNVPSLISTPQPEGVRLVGGKRVESGYGSDR